MQNYKRDLFKEAHTLLKQQGYKNYIIKLLPNGKWQGNEYVVKNPTRSDNKAGSFSINGVTGTWSDFATNDAGKDLISLTSYIKGISLVEACHYIGVPRLEKNTAKTSVEAHTAANTNNKINNSIQEDKAILKSEEEAIASIDNKPTEEELVEVSLNVLELTENNLSRRTKDRFKGGKLSFYHYYSSKNVPVGCVVRCDKNVGGDKYKSFAMHSYDHIKKQWQASWSVEGKPLYNLPEIVARPDATVLIVEGEKTAEAAKQLFPDYVVTTSCNGAASPKKTNWSYLSGRDVIISPDNDAGGAKYARVVNDILLSHSVNSIKGLDVKKLGRFKIENNEPKTRDERVPDKYDLADCLEDGWTAELIKAYQEHEDFAPFFEVIKDVQAVRELVQEGEEIFHIKGANYKLNSKTSNLWWEKVKEDKRSSEIIKTWLSLCGYIKPLYCMEDAEGNHGLLVEIVTRRDKKVECFFPRDEIATEKDTIKLLLKKGLSVPHLKTDYTYAINFYLNNFEPKDRATGVSMAGWQNKKSYILPFVDAPRNTYKVDNQDNTTEYILQQNGVISRELQKKGTLTEWKRTVGEVTKGNHLHCFSIMVALTAPILKLMNEEGGFFHFVGASSIGKSSILQVAMSVWGNTEMGTFRATDNNLEGICKEANDGVIFLDEMGECEADALSRIVYMVANGVTKGRADRSGNARAITHFKVLALSSGEKGIEEKLAEKKIYAKAGQMLRMGELDADRGKGLATFDIININPDTQEKFKNGAEQAEYLKLHARENCGVIIDAFMTEFVKDPNTYIRGIKKLKDEWTKQLNRTTVQPEIDRMIKKLSTIYATGVTASVMGILPYKKEEILEYLNSIFENWLNRRGGDVSYELQAIINNIYKLGIENQYSRFQDADGRHNASTFIKNKAGFFKEDEEIDKETSGIDEFGNKKREYKYILRELWFYPKAFDSYVLKGSDKKAFLPLLIKKGIIKQFNDGRYTQARRPKNQDPQRFYVVPVEALLDIAK
jgi:uncharacterized protein (DUF927 family)